MKNFIKHVNWTYFFKIIGILSFVLIFSKFSPAKDAQPISWLFIIFMILFVSTVLLSMVYTQMMMNKKRVVLTKNQIRMKKLKKLNRRW